ncbi:MAG: 4-hydroxy-tetrahydrodipicolinate reductase [Pirellulaceae bacterium]
MAQPIALAIHGAAGRMGRRLVALGAKDAMLKIAAAIDRPEAPWIGQDAGSLAGIDPIGVQLASQWPQGLDVVIDFSTPHACDSAVQNALVHRIPIVVATTGLEPGTLAAIQKASKEIAVCHAPNMSLAVNLTMNLAKQAARALRGVPGGVDVEIIERHHRYKEDSPSGTALQFGKLIANELGLDRAEHGRVGQVGARPENAIGYHAVRAGDDPGQHTILFGMLGELIELRVAASNRDCYAAGALAAAKYLVGKPAGLYSMNDVLGLS